MKATATAGANIAFVKYWGNVDRALNLPLNNSISMTLDAAYTLTTVEFAAAHPADTLELNGWPGDAAVTARMSLHLDRLRALAGTQWRARVATTNSFPTGAGIASSASGFAALTLAACAALGVQAGEQLLSRLARLASGSACRSVQGGFVEWQAGTIDADSYAIQLAPAGHWPLRDIVAVVARGAKSVSSEAGHRLAHSSPLLAGRLAATAAALEQCRAAIAARDLAALGAVAEADALSLHAIAMTSRPAVLYWSPATVALLHAVHAWRQQGIGAYFTIDAGPNVHIITEDRWQAAVVERLHALPEVLDIIVCGPGRGATLSDSHLF